jgi:hypothetical protein
MNTIIGTFNLRARYEAFREACPSGPHRFVWRRVLNRQRLVLHWPNKSSTARVVGITGAISGLQEQMGLKSGLSTNMGERSADGLAIRNGEDQRAASTAEPS